MLKSLSNRALRIVTSLKIVTHTGVSLLKFLRILILKKICKRLFLKPVQISTALHFFDIINFWLKLVRMF